MAMCVGMFMAILDVQVAATSLPTIQSALDINPDQMSWIQTAYLIAEFVAIRLTGVPDPASQRSLFVTSLTLFVIASAGCAISGSFGELVPWLLLQGFSGGTLIPSLFSAVFILFPKERQAIATTIAGVLAVLTPTVGPVVGGCLTETYSWHWLFLINVIPGIVAALVAIRSLPRKSVDTSELRYLDGLSLVLMAISSASFELALKEAPTSGWTSFYIAGFGLSALCGCTFVWLCTGRGRSSISIIFAIETLSSARFSASF